MLVVQESMLRTGFADTKAFHATTIQTSSGFGAPMLPNMQSLSSLGLGVDASTLAAAAALSNNPLAASASAQNLQQLGQLGQPVPSVHDLQQLSQAYSSHHNLQQLAQSVSSQNLAQLATSMSSQNLAAAQLAQSLSSQNLAQLASSLPSTHDLTAQLTAQAMGSSASLHQLASSISSQNLQQLAAAASVGASNNPLSAANASAGLTAGAVNSRRASMDAATGLGPSLSTTSLRELEQQQAAAAKANTSLQAYLLDSAWQAHALTMAMASQPTPTLQSQLSQQRSPCSLLASVQSAPVEATTLSRTNTGPSFAVGGVGDVTATAASALGASVPPSATGAGPGSASSASAGAAASARRQTAPAASSAGAVFSLGAPASDLSQTSEDRCVALVQQMITSCSTGLKPCRFSRSTPSLLLPPPRINAPDSPRFCLSPFHIA